MAGQGYGAGVQTAPGVYTREIDNATTVPAGASSIGAFAGLFSWGPVGLPVLVNSEDDLTVKFGLPSNFNAETWFVAANFFAYGNAMYVNRVGDSGNTLLSAISTSGSVANVGKHTVNNTDDFQVKVTNFDPNVNFIARYPGALGNSLKISVCASPAQYSSSVNLQTAPFNSTATAITYTVGSNVAAVAISNTAVLTNNTPLPYATSMATSLVVGDYITVGNTSIGVQQVKVTSIGAITVANTAGANTGSASFSVGLDQPIKLADNYVSSTIARKWEFSSVADIPMTTYSTGLYGNTAAVDGMSVVIVDALGKFTNRPGAILEVFNNVSRATDATDAGGSLNYYGAVINSISKYMWVASPLASLPTAPMLTVASVAGTAATTQTFVSGANGPDEATVAVSVVSQGFSPYKHADEYPISSIIVGKSRGGQTGEQIFNYIIDNVAEVRTNLFVYGSPSKESIVNNADPLTAVSTFRSNLRRTSYAAVSSAYKFQYDKYNDVFRYIPGCGDDAGISARTDITNDPWFPPAGYNRGQYKNLIKLAWNPTAADQAVLFANDINPVVTTRGDGTYLMGDKTLYGQSSALGEIGVRKMLNVLKTTIAKAAKTLLFEFNDEFTRARLKSLVEPYLRDIQGRRGLQSFGVTADTTNNTVQVIDSNQFVGDIYLVPNRSIRTIFLNFIVDGSNVVFNESISK